jgi:hypothetical protein
MSYNSGSEERRLRTVFRKLNAEEFEPFVAFLESRRDEISDTLAKGTEMQTLYRAQGRLEVVKDLLNLIERNRNFS